MKNQIESTRLSDVSPVVPVGVPMGKLSSMEDADYLVRSEGAFLVLSALEYAVFCQAHTCRRMSELITGIAKRWGRPYDEVSAITQTMEERCLLMEISKENRNSQEQLQSLRVVPRAITLGSIREPPGSFMVLSASESHQLVLDAVGYAIWSRFDGYTNLSAAVDETSRDSGLTTSHIWDRCLVLVVSAMRAGVILLDW